MQTLKPFLPYMLALMIGLVFSQTPLIANKYDQALGVEIDRIDIALRSIDEEAQSRRMDRFEYIKQLQTEGDAMQKEMAKAQLELLSRRQTLVNAEKIFTDDNGGDSFLMMVLYFDGRSFLQALKFYTPGIEISLSWIGHFILGIFLGITCNFLPFFFRSREVPIPAEVHLENEEGEVNKGKKGNKGDGDDGFFDLDDFDDIVDEQNQKPQRRFS